MYQHPFLAKYSFLFEFLSSKPFPVSLNSSPNIHFEADMFYTIQFIAALLSALIYSFHIPERFSPGRFDIIGQSHQIFHLTAFTCTWSQFMALSLDMKHLIRQNQQVNFEDEFYLIYNSIDSNARVPFTNIKVSCTFVIVICIIINSLILVFFYLKAVYFNPWIKRNGSELQNLMNKKND